MGAGSDLVVVRVRVLDIMQHHYEDLYGTVQGFDEMERSTNFVVSTRDSQRR